MHPVLKLDSAGNPRQWISTEVAAHYVAKGQVSWQLGANLQVLRGGYNKQGARSVLEVPSIIAITGPVSAQGIDGTVSVRKDYLLKRDRQTCAYCGERYPREYLQMEHIIPQSRGGKTTWQNTVCACGFCNSRKADRNPEEAGMPLLYVPYVPNKHEGLILQGRRVLVDQMDFLMRGVPAHSRLRA